MTRIDFLVKEELCFPIYSMASSRKLNQTRHTGQKERNCNQTQSMTARISTRTTSSCCAIHKWPGQYAHRSCCIILSGELVVSVSCPPSTDCVHYGLSAAAAARQPTTRDQEEIIDNGKGRIEFMFCGNPFIISGSCPICVLLLSCCIIALPLFNSHYIRPG